MRTAVLRGSHLPARLRDLREPPTELFLHGEWPNGPIVCVVGTRNPSEEGRAFTRQLCRELAQEGVVVASGGAKGVDTAAHQGALEAGATLVVAPAGFNHPFPDFNEGLFRAIVEGGGAYVSEYPPDRIVRRHVFFRRNALLVALSDIVVVTESPWRSGARNAAKWARRLARPLFVVPHSPWNRPGGGWVEEHRLGAGLVQGARDVLDALGRLNLHALGSTGGPVGAQLELRLAAAATSAPPEALLALLHGGPRHLDDLVEQSGLSAAEVQTAVAELALEDRVAVSALGIVSLPGLKPLPRSDHAR